MEVKHFKLVKAVHEEGNLTKAAEKLYLTQSALSHQLKEIESDLGVKLFNRINKRLVFTEAGNKMLISARIILDEIEKTEKEIKSYSTGDSGTIRLTTECYTSYNWLPKALTIFNKKYPNVEIRIEANSTHFPYEALLEGKIDLGIVSETPPSSKIKITPLFNDELYLLVNKRNRLFEKKFIRAIDLADQTLITYSIDDSDLTIFTKLLNPAGIRPQKVLKIQLTEAIIEMVKSHLGVTAIAGWAVKNYIKNHNNLKIIPIGKKGLKRTWSVATLCDQAYQPYYYHFIEIMKGISPLK